MSRVESRRKKATSQSETGHVHEAWMAVNDFMETRLMGLSDYFRVGTGAPPQFIIPTRQIIRSFLNLIRPIKPPTW
mgnify:CR=1 FL=1